MHLNPCGFLMLNLVYTFIFIIQRVKARAISCPHQPEIRSDNTVSVTQGGTATPGSTKQLLTGYSKELYIYVRSTKSRGYIVRSSSFLQQFVIFKNAFTFGRWCHYALTVTVSWCYMITREWWSRMHFIHTEDFSLSTKSNFMHIAPWSNGASAFSLPILTFLSVSVVYSVGFFFSVLSLLGVTAPNHSKQTGVSSWCNG